MISEGPGKKNEKTLSQKTKKTNKQKKNKKKSLHSYPQCIDRDVRAPEGKNPKDEEYHRQFTKKMCEFTTGAPVAILPLIKNFTTLPKFTRNWTMNLLIRLKLIS